MLEEHKEEGLEVRPQWESHWGQPEEARPNGGAQYDGGNCKHWLNPTVITSECGPRVS